MSCCAAPIDVCASAHAGDELRAASRALDAGLRQSDISVPTIHCGACIRTIESTLIKLPGVESVRVNLSTKRVAVRWLGSPPPLLETLRVLGFEAHLCDPEVDGIDRRLRQLVLALAVAGFASTNIMMLSIGIWAGAESATRNLFHGLSALIALPALIYSGRIFFDSAWRAICHGRTNMDVPISIGVLLAFGLSLYETAVNGAHAYFDAATMLLFFLLIGRTLDHVMRERARVAITGLARLAPRGANVLGQDGTQTYTPLDDIRPGMPILLAAGERVPVDSTVTGGRSEVDCSLITGESLPQLAVEGAALEAGTLNLTGALTIVAVRAADRSFLAEMLRMLEAAEAGRSTYRRVADRVASYYAPVVHLAALLTFVAWMWIGADLHRSLTVAIAVLIITCPCAIGLAVPMVQVAAARRLFESGIMVKDGSALERLAEVDHVVFDKTGTLTLGKPRIVEMDLIDPDALGIAVAIASHSRHPYSLALARVGARVVASFDEVHEVPGKGLEASVGAVVYRLGRGDWAAPERPAGLGDIALAKDGRLLATFCFDDGLRADARAAIQALRSLGISAEIVSGDSEQAVVKAGLALDLPHLSRISPAGKVDRIKTAGAAGRKVLMVGDGLNDAPALAAAYASMAPSSAADVGRSAADLVFLGDGLMAVSQAVAVARRAAKLVRQNMVLAVVYNVLAVPIAVAGEVTPLIAAAAMSLSSILVVGNSFRLRGGRRGTAQTKGLGPVTGVPAAAQGAT